MFSVMFVLMACHATFAQLPFPETVGERTDAMQATMDAKRDTKPLNSQAWTFAGCFGSTLGVVGAYAMTPSVPPAKLLGKSPEYVDSYIQTYQQEMKNKRAKHAVIGCVGSQCVVAMLYGMGLRAIYYGGHED